MEFVVNGRRLTLTAEQVEVRLRGAAPEYVQTHGVRVVGTVYPVKQAFSVATGLTRAEFASQTPSQPPGLRAHRDRHRTTSHHGQANGV